AIGDEGEQAISKQDNRSDGSLVPAGRRDLATAVGANPLVLRGLAELIQGNAPKRNEDLRSMSDQAFFCLLLGDPDQAIRLYESLIRLAPTHSFAYVLRGVAWLRKSQNGSDLQACDKAIRDFEQALDLDPNEAPAYEYRGVAWYFKKEYDKAIEDFE